MGLSFKAKTFFSTLLVLNALKKATHTAKSSLRMLGKENLTVLKEILFGELNAFFSTLGFKRVAKKLSF